MAITHGCIRMYPEDIEALFPLVPMNTPVWLINEPVKVARVGGQVWASCPGVDPRPPVPGSWDYGNCGWGPSIA
jgi:L,D-transpeptidase ErfK/SrfK